MNNIDRGIYPLLILDYLRDHSIATVEDLFKECIKYLVSNSRIDLEHYRESSTIRSIFDACLDSLIREQFVEIVNKFPYNIESDHYKSGFISTATQIKITDKLKKIQPVISYSLKETIEVYLYGKFTKVRPLWNHPSKVRIDVFVIMPFGDIFDSIFDKHIKKVCLKHSLSCKRADAFFYSRSIVKDIWDSIYNAKVIICDCTGKNPNVFYELGIAHTVGKDVILTTQNKDDIPFDIKDLRYIKYEHTERGMSDFEESLGSFIDGSIKSES